MTYNAHIYGKYGQLPYKSVTKVADSCDKERLIAFMLSKPFLPIFIKVCHGSLPYIAPFHHLL